MIRHTYLCVFSCYVSAFGMLFFCLEVSYFIYLYLLKKKLYNLLPFLSGDLSDCLSVNFSSDEILVLSLSLKLYYSLLCGRVEVLNELFEGLDVNFSTILLVEKLKDNRDLFTNLIDKEIPFDISSNYIYYKAKWAWDMFNVLEGLEYGKIGSIPLLKIEEVDDSRRFRH